MNHKTEINLFNGIERHHVIELLEWLSFHPGKDPYDEFDFSCVDKKRFLDIAGKEGNHKLRKRLEKLIWGKK